AFFRIKKIPNKKKRLKKKIKNKERKRLFHGENSYEVVFFPPALNSWWNNVNVNAICINDVCPLAFIFNFTILILHSVSKRLH
ncbi:hypothetical protein, partial [Pseudomonas aeruginosa]|uniref:hypothetical protein n=1 Tax=Pseudomonas aeruginosa TaxID=287 RepID=UPI0038913862